MDELEIAGKRYISAKRAGKDNKYHPDYIGQLIRAGKVGGQKVGRAWYVSADSLAAYLGQEPAVRGPMLAKRENGLVENAEPRMQVKEDREEPSIEAEKNKNNSTYNDADTGVEEPAMDTEKEMADEHHIPIKTFNSNYTAPEEKIEIPSAHTPNKAGLRYIPDEGPLFPAIGKSTISVYSGMPAQKTYEEQSVRILPRSAIKKSFLPSMRSVAVIAVLGIIAFGGVILATRYVTSVTLVEEGKPASVWYSVK